MSPDHATTYDRDVWQAAVLLMVCHGMDAATYAARQVHVELASHQPSAAVVWSQIAEIVLDWYRAMPRTGEGIH